MNTSYTKLNSSYGNNIRYETKTSDTCFHKKSRHRIKIYTNSTPLLICKSGLLLLSNTTTSSNNTSR